MKSIAEIVQNAAPRHVAQTAQIDDFAAQNINRIFKQLCVIFPGWRSCFRDQSDIEAAKANFTRGMIESGVVSMEQVKRGFVKARQQETDFFPSVGKFCSWCLDDDSWREAFERMIRREKPLSLAEKRARQESSWEVRHNLDKKTAEKAFQKAFKKWTELEKLGEIVEVPALPQHSMVNQNDIANSRVVINPNKYRAGSIFHRIALRGAGVDV